MTRSPHHRPNWWTGRPFQKNEQQECEECGGVIAFVGRLNATGNLMEGRGHCSICGKGVALALHVEVEVRGR